MTPTFVKRRKLSCTTDNNGGAIYLFRSVAEIQTHSCGVNIFEQLDTNFLLLGLLIIIVQTRNSTKNKLFKFQHETDNSI